jgi:hypothetical protein
MFLFLLHMGNIKELSYPAPSLCIRNLFCSIPVIKSVVEGAVCFPYPCAIFIYFIGLSILAVQDASSLQGRFMSVRSCQTFS